MPDQVIPEPECRFGFSERQLAELLGHRMAEFREYMLMKAHPRCEGVDCSEPHDDVYYAHDVRRFVEHQDAVDRVFARIAAEPRAEPTPEQRAASLDRAARWRRLQERVHEQMGRAEEQ